MGTSDHYAKYFKDALERRVRRRALSRVFRTFAGNAGRRVFPTATWYKDDKSETEITVWCSNDYLGMGQERMCGRGCKVGC